MKYPKPSLNAIAPRALMLGAPNNWKVPPVPGAGSVLNTICSIA
jgi:hypothetical protein